MVPLGVSPFEDTGSLSYPLCQNVFLPLVPPWRLPLISLWGIGRQNLNLSLSSHFFPVLAIVPFLIFFVFTVGGGGVFPLVLTCILFHDSTTFVLYFDSRIAL